MKRGSLAGFGAAWLLALLTLISGCTTLETAMVTARGGPGQRLDPWEGWNRKVFGFNEALDVNVLKPVAIGYAKVVPSSVREGVKNVFNNFADAWSAVNNVLQGKFELGAKDLARVSVNTIFGLGGVLDVASELGLEHSFEDFGQTLGHWGFGAGAYVVWPLFGPSTVRETLALPFDRAVSPALVIAGGTNQVGLTVLQLLNVRAGLLNAGKLVDDIALDKYSFVRDAYLQRRRSLVFDGDPPPAPEPPEPAAPAASAPAVKK